MSIDGPKKSRGRGRPRVDSEPVKLRIEREVLDALDVYLKRHPILRNRQMAIMSLIEEALVGAGLLQDNTMRIGLLLFAERKGLSDKEFAERLIKAERRRRLGIGPGDDIVGKEVPGLKPPVPKEE
jgi:hypothetical protein